MSDSRKRKTQDVDEAIRDGWFKLMGPNKNVAKFLQDMAGYENEKLNESAELGRFKHL